MNDLGRRYLVALQTKSPVLVLFFAVAMLVTGILGWALHWDFFIGMSIAFAVFVLLSLPALLRRRKP